MANYSKWDKFAAELSDDSDVEDNVPQVTTLDGTGGKTVQIGPQGYTVKETKSTTTNTSSRVEVLSSSANVGDNEASLEAKNGAVCEGYSWSQDRYEAVLSIPLPEGVRARDIKLTFAEKKLRITHKESILLEGTLRYDALTAAERKDDEAAAPLDWEIRTKVSPSEESRRVLEVVLRKKSPIPGAFIWWKNVFASDTYEIDVSKITGRTNIAQDNFVAAQQQFLEKVGKMEQIEVNVGEDDAADDEN